MEKDVYLNSVSFPLWHKAIDKIICGAEGQMLLKQRRLGRGVQNNYKNKKLSVSSLKFGISGLFVRTCQIYSFFTYSQF